MPKMRTLCMLGNFAITSTSSTIRFSPSGCRLRSTRHCQDVSKLYTAPKLLVGLAQASHHL